MTASRKTSATKTAALAMLGAGLTITALTGCGGSTSSTVDSATAAAASAASAAQGAASSAASQAQDAASNAASAVASATASQDSGFSFSIGGGDTLNSEKLQKAVEAEIVKVVPNSTAAVTCPGDVKAEAGATFNCTAVVNGQNATIVVTQKDADGNVNFESQQAFLFQDKAQTAVTNYITEKVPGTWSTTCEMPGAQGGVYVATPGGTFTCQVTGTTAAGEKQSGTATVTVDDNQGNVSIQVN